MTEAVCHRFQPDGGKDNCDTAEDGPINFMESYTGRTRSPTAVESNALRQMLRFDLQSRNFNVFPRVSGTQLKYRYKYFRLLHNTAEKIWQ